MNIQKIKTIAYWFLRNWYLTVISILFLALVYKQGMVDQGKMENASLQQTIKTFNENIDYQRQISNCERQYKECETACEKNGHLLQKYCPHKDSLGNPVLMLIGEDPYKKDTVKSYCKICGKQLYIPFKPSL